MSLTRKYSKVLAIASNYDIPDVGIETIKSSFSFNAPTVDDGLEFAELQPFVTNPDWTVFDIHALSVTAQVASTTGSITFDLYQRPDTDLSSYASVTLPISQNFAQYETISSAEGMSKSNRYFIKCSCNSGVFAEGVQLTYTLRRM